MGYLESKSWKRETFWGPVSVQVGEGEREMEMCPVWPAMWMLWTRRWRASRGVRRGMENVPVGVVFIAISLLVACSSHNFVNS
jgi:hypothetical protein